KRMLGFCCCWAAAGTLAIPTAPNASRASQSFRMTVMENLLTFRGSWEKTEREQPHRGLLYCRGQQSLRVIADSNGASPVSAMQKDAQSLPPPFALCARSKRPRPWHSRE